MESVSVLCEKREERHGAELKIRVAAPPVDGKANSVLIAFIASVFDVPLKQVTLLRGDSGRCKVIKIVGSKKDLAILFAKPSR